MAAAVPDKTPATPPTLVSSSSPSYLLSLASPFTSVLDRFSSWKSGKGLSYPGSVENLQQEVRQTHLTNFMFDGARADLTKGLSVDPGFQVTHSFQLGAQNAPPSYHLNTVFVNPTLLMQGGISDDGAVSGRFNYQWSPSQISRVQAQLSSSQSVGVLEHEILGADYSLSLRGINPSPANGTGVYIGNFLQSVNKNLALGFETLFQRPMPDVSETSTSYMLKYTGDNKDWIATAQVQPAGILQATYWHKLSEKVEVAAELQLMNGPQRREAVTTVGAKYDLHMSTFRAQVDSTGKVSALLEQKFAPTFSFLFAGEIDHWKNAAKVGVGVMIESTSLTPEEMGLPPQH